MEHRPIETSHKPSIAEVEIAKQEGFSAQARSTAVHYVPYTEEEKILDRRVNLKFDFCIILILSLGFIVCLISRQKDYR
jgi:hypothetical protein